MEHYLVSQPPTAESLELVMLESCQNDSAVIANATAVIKEWQKFPETTLALLNVLQRSQYAHIRQLAAILLKRTITSWGKHSRETQEQIKTLLLELLTHEPMLTIASYVSVLARFLLRGTGWPQLLAFISSAVLSSESTMQTASQLLALICEDCTDVLATNYASIHPLFVKVLTPTSDDEFDNAITVINKLGLVMAYIQDDSIALAKSLMPAVKMIFEECIKRNDENGTGAIASMIVDVLESNDTILISTLPDIVDVCLGYFVSDKTGSWLLTRGVLSVLYWSLMMKPNLVAKSKARQSVMPRFFTALFNNMTQVTASTWEDEDDEAPHKYCAKLLMELSKILPPKTFSSLFPIIEQCLRHQRPNVIRTGLISLGMVSECCTDSITANASGILTAVAQCMAHADGGVRHSACMTLGMIAQTVAHDAADAFNQTLNPLFHLLHDYVCQSQACETIEAICDNLRELVAPFGVALCTEILSLLDVLSKITNDYSQVSTPSNPHITPSFRAALVLETKAISLLSAVCTMDDVDLAPVVSALENVALSYLQSTLMHTLYAERNAKAFNLLGQLCRFSSHDVIMRRIEIYVGLINARINDGGMNEAILLFLGSLAKTLKSDFPTDFMDKCVDLACKVLSDEDEIVRMKKDQDNDDDDEDDVGGGKLTYQLSTAILDEKATAAYFLGTVAESCGSAIVHRADVVIPLLNDATRHFHEDLRYSAARALGSMARALGQASGGDTVTGEWSVSTCINADMSATLNPILSSIFDALFVYVNDEPDPEAVTIGADSIAVIVRVGGPLWCIPMIDGLMEMVVKALTGKLHCAQENSDDGDGDDDDDDDSAPRELFYDGFYEILTSLCDAVGYGQHLQAIVKSSVLYPVIYGTPSMSTPAFPEQFETASSHFTSLFTARILPTMNNLIQSPKYRLGVLGTIAECFRDGGVHFRRAVWGLVYKPILSLFNEALRSSIHEIVRNIAYFIGWSGDLIEFNHDIIERISRGMPVPEMDGYKEVINMLIAADKQLQTSKCICEDECHCISDARDNIGSALARILVTWYENIGACLLATGCHGDVAAMRSNVIQVWHKVVVSVFNQNDLLSLISSVTPPQSDRNETDIIIRAAALLSVIDAWSVLRPRVVEAASDCADVELETSTKCLLSAIHVV